MRNNIKITALFLMALMTATLVLLSIADEKIMMPDVIFGSFLVCTTMGLLAYLGSRFLLKSKHLPLVLLTAIPTIYYGLGLLPISSRRDYFDSVFWLESIFIINASIFSGWHLAGLAVKKQLRQFSSRNTKLLEFIFLCIFTIGAFAAVLVVVQYGVVLLNPNIRFLISSYYLYSIELIVVAVIFLFALKQQNGSITRTYTFVLLISSSIFLSASGYRSQIVLLLVGLILYYLISQNLQPESKSFKTIPRRAGFGVFAVFLILSVGYYLRVEFSGDGILGWEQRVAELEIANSNFLLPLLPIHESARENMGVTTTALNRLPDIAGFGSLNSFIWIELLTLLPGYSETATGILGQVVNRSQSDFLTPGVIGGLYISHDYIGLIIYFCGISALARHLWKNAIRSNDHAYYASLSIFFIYYIHFMYRGIIRPMYVIVFILLALVLTLSKNSNEHK